MGISLVIPLPHRVLLLDQIPTRGAGFQVESACSVENLQVRLPGVAITYPCILVL